MEELLNFLEKKNDPYYGEGLINPRREYDGLARRSESEESEESEENEEGVNLNEENPTVKIRLEELLNFLAKKNKYLLILPTHQEKRGATQQSIKWSSLTCI